MKTNYEDIAKTILNIAYDVEVNGTTKEAIDKIVNLLTLNFKFK